MKLNLFCEKCGKKISKSDKFCPYCGELILERKEIKRESKLNEKKRHNNFITIIAIIFITLFLCITTTFLIINFYYSNDNTTTIVDKKNVTITDTGIADAVDKVYDAVVVIKTYKNEKLYATGTGFVFEKDKTYGYILTNNHVLESGDKYTATFTNGKEIETSLVGKDSYSDVAVLRVDVSNVIMVAQIGSSKDLRVGDTTFAVGAPVDSSAYSWTVTRGILSGKNREVEITTESSAYSASNMVMEVLQTDTPINSGNSGGPLCNANGEVIGITNMKLSSTTIEGIGFAIPIETAITYADKFINGEDVLRPYLGIGMYFVSPNLYSDVTVTGVYIDTVEDNSTASKAGLKKGDIITKVDGVEVKSAAYFKYQLYKHNVGDTVTLTYTRNNKEKEIKVTLAAKSINE